MALSVVGAGLGRTGTMSLKLALEHLGFNPCFHMLELFPRPALMPYWIRAADGAPEWDTMFEGFQATVDWPSCTFYRQLAAHYPDAKVILTVRDAEKWFRSTQDTIFKHMDQTMAAPDNVFGQVLKKTIASMFGGRIHDRERCIEVFNRHNADVQKTIQAPRLLVFNVAEGWGPLCRFLDVPVPRAPFPAANSTEEFQQRHAELAAGKRS
jgi:hypothetical protein